MHQSISRSRSRTTEHIKVNNRNNDGKINKGSKANRLEIPVSSVLFRSIRSLVSSASRVGVISTRPRTGTTISLQRVVDADNGSISACNGHECADDNNKDAPANHKIPLGRLVLLALVPVIIEPHTSVRLETHHCTQESSNERHKTSEDGDSASNDVGDDGHAACAGQPGGPVHDTVGVEVLSASQQTDEKVLGRNLELVSKDITSKDREHSRES